MTEPPFPKWWWEPPTSTVGGVVASVLIFARTSALVVYGTSIRAYATGFGFTVHVVQRWPRSERDAHRRGEVLDVLSASSWPVKELRAREAAGLINVEAENLTREVLGPTMEIAYADGRRCRLHEDDRREFNWMTPDDFEREGPVVRRVPGGASRSDSGAQSSSRFWVWPLPPDGPVAIRFVWPDLDLDGTDELDGSALRRAAAASFDLWPDDHGN